MNAYYFPKIKQSRRFGTLPINLLKKTEQSYGKREVMLRKHNSKGMQPVRNRQAFFTDQQQGNVSSFDFN